MIFFDYRFSFYQLGQFENCNLPLLMVVDVHKGAISDNMKYQCFTALKVGGYMQCL